MFISLLICAKIKNYNILVENKIKIATNLYSLKEVKVYIIFYKKYVYLN